MGTESLNAGNELDNEAVFTDPVANEIPDLDGDLHLITSFEHRFDDLCGLAQDIETASGMNQGFALEAERLLPGFVNERTPIGYYSKDTSATRLRVSMEEITKGMWALIAAAIAASLALIIKLISWFRGGSKGDSADGGGGGSSSDTSKAEDDSEKHDAAASGVQRLVETHKNAVNDKTDSGETLGNVAKQMAIDKTTKVYAFLSEQNEAVADFLEHGSLAQHIEKLCGQLPKLASAFDAKLTVFDKMLEREISSSKMTADQELLSDAARLEEPIPLDLGGSLKGTLADVAESITTEFNTKHAQEKMLSRDYTKALEGLEKAINGGGMGKTLSDNIAWVESLTDFEEQLKRSSAKLEKNENGDYVNLTVESAKHIQKSTTFVTAEAVAISKLKHAVLKSSELLIRVYKQARETELDIAGELKRRAKEDKVEVPKAVEAVVAVVEEIKAEEKKTRRLPFWKRGKK